MHRADVARHSVGARPVSLAKLGTVPAREAPLHDTYEIRL